MPLVLTIAALTIATLALAVISLWRHKKAARRPLDLMGATGITESRLDPEGAVVINGEIWRARVENDSTLRVRNQVRVVGVRAHLLLVAPLSDDR